MALQTLAAKVQPETKEQYQRALEESGANTANQFIEMLLESFLNPKTETVEVPTPTQAQTEALQLKDNEIGRLKTENSLTDDSLKEATRLIQELKDKIQSLETSKRELENRPPEQLKLENNQVLVDLEPVPLHVLKIEADVKARKLKNPVALATILKDCFWETIRDGRYVPHRIWSETEIKRVHQAIDKAKAERINNAD